jgi:hypothetical protein
VAAAPPFATQGKRHGLLPRRAKDTAFCRAGQKTWWPGLAMSPSRGLVLPSEAGLSCWRLHYSLGRLQRQKPRRRRCTRRSLVISSLCDGVRVAVGRAVGVAAGAGVGSVPRPVSQAPRWCCAIPGTLVGGGAEVGHRTAYASVVSRYLSVASGQSPQPELDYQHPLRTRLDSQEAFVDGLEPGRLDAELGPTDQRTSSVEN